MEASGCAVESPAVAPVALVVPVAPVVRFCVTTLGGTQQVLQADASATLAELRLHIAEALDLDVDGLQLLLGERLLLSPTVAADLDGRTLTATVQPWCAGKHFSYHYHECDSTENRAEDWELTVAGDGTFHCVHRELYIDAESGFRENTTASGEWTCDGDLLALTSENAARRFGKFSPEEPEPQEKDWKGGVPWQHCFLRSFLQGDDWEVTDLH